MYKQEFIVTKNNPNGSGEPWKVVSVVLSDEEWDKFINLVESLPRVVDYRSQTRIDDQYIEKMRVARHIPMISRGTKTKALFDYLEVIGVDYMSVIVRGHGVEVAQKSLGLNVLPKTPYMA